MIKCKKCGSDNLILKQKSKETDNIMQANMVALVCKDCGAWVKWCPKEERYLYVKNNVAVVSPIDNNPYKIIDDKLNKIQSDLDFIKAIIETLKENKHE